jgi:hypothetical protein
LVDWSYMAPVKIMSGSMPQHIPDPGNPQLF